MIPAIRLGRFVVALVVVGLLVHSAPAAAPVPSGLNPGDTYQLIFVTSGTRDATSLNVADYNAFVQTAADNAGIGASMGITWKAVVSFQAGNPSSLFARDNAAVSAPVYNMLGDLIATGFSDLWDATLANPIRYTEQGTQTFWSQVWTGTNFTGTNSSSFSIAHTKSAYGSPFVTTGGDWVEDGVEFATGARPLYGISSVLTVVPEPTSLALIGMGGLAALRRRR